MCVWGGGGVGCYNVLCEGWLANYTMDFIILHLNSVEQNSDSIHQKTLSFFSFFSNFCSAGSGTSEQLKDLHFV